MRPIVQAPPLFGGLIRYAVWLYFRFTLSFRDVEELLAWRGAVVSREAIRCWVNKFRPLIAANLSPTTSVRDSPD